MPRLPGKARSTTGIPRGQRDLSEDRACLGKIWHRTWAEAEAEVQRIIAGNIATGRTSFGLGAYRCEYCGNWHVGHGRGPIDIPTYHGPGFRKRRAERLRRRHA